MASASCSSWLRCVASGEPTASPSARQLQLHHAFVRPAETDEDGSPPRTSTKQSAKRACSVLGRAAPSEDVRVLKGSLLLRLTKPEIWPRVLAPSEDVRLRPKTCLCGSGVLPLRLPNALDAAVDTGDPQENDGVQAVTEGADHARSCRNASPTEVGTADSENHDDRVG